MDHPDSRERTVYIASQELVKVSSLLPSNRNRSLMVHSLVSALGLLKPNPLYKRRIQVVNPTRATPQALSMYHSKDYLDFVLHPNPDTTTASEFGLEDASCPSDCPLFPGLSDYVPLVGGATLTATETLKTGFAEVAICWDGGRHHARKSKASGFCYVADCTLALLSLKKPTPTIPKPRVMYLDLDLHFSDGVSESFYTPNSAHSQILTFSIHHAAPGFFPVSPQADLPSPTTSDTSVSPSAFDPFTLSIPLAQGASNKTYERIWPIVERVRDVFKPDYTILQCGVDALAGDPYGVFNWSSCGSRVEDGVGGGPGPGSLGWCVDKVVNGWAGRKLLLGGGGYSSPNAARTWAYLTSIALGSPLDSEIEIPDHSAFPLYAPSFTLDVPAGNMQDRNTEEYLQSIENTYERIIDALEHRMSSLPLT